MRVYPTRLAWIDRHGHLLGHISCEFRPFCRVSLSSWPARLAGLSAAGRWWPAAGEAPVGWQAGSVQGMRSAEQRSKSSITSFARAGRCHYTGVCRCKGPRVLLQGCCSGVAALAGNWSQPTAKRQPTASCPPAFANCPPDPTRCRPPPAPRARKKREPAHQPVTHSH